MSEPSVIEDVPRVGGIAAAPAISPRGDHERVDRAGESSWLCAGAAERARMLDMDRRLAPVRALALGVLAVAALANSAWFGIWTLAPIAFAGVGFAVGARLSERSDRPEYVLFGSWVFSELVIAATILIAGLHSGLLAWLAIPVITLSARFSARGVLAGVLVALGLAALVAFMADASAVINYPPTLVAPAAVIIAVGILSTALMNSDFEHRGEAVIDRLTGMLNRNALTRRADELEQQSKVTGEPIAIVVGDLDHFKAVNDTLGHAVGDRVLADIAYSIRKQLRAFDAAYRLGGEEFLILMPGSTDAGAAEIAESLRQTIAAQSFAGREVTMSFGVSATYPGQEFDYERQFALADAALYQAKDAGRNRVVAATR